MKDLLEIGNSITGILSMVAAFVFFVIGVYFFGQEAYNLSNFCLLCAVHFRVQAIPTTK